MATVVITGANRGIGLALTRNYLSTGDTVWALCRNPDKADKLKELEKDAGGRLHIAAIDIGDTAAVERAAKTVEGPVDILINNAGSVETKTTLEDTDLDEWKEMLNIMTLGPFRVVRAFLPKLESANDGARVMTVSSQLAASTWPYGGYYGYSSAKAASNRVMQSLALDLKERGITVASIHPGYVKTDMGGQTADIEPEDSAAGVRKVTDGLRPEDSGKFFKWTGELHPL